MSNPHECNLLKKDKKERTNSYSTQVFENYKIDSLLSTDNEKYLKVKNILSNLAQNEIINNKQSDLSLINTSDYEPIPCQEQKIIEKKFKSKPKIDSEIRQGSNSIIRARRDSTSFAQKKDESDYSNEYKLTDDFSFDEIQDTLIKIDQNLSFLDYLKNKGIEEFFEEEIKSNEKIILTPELKNKGRESVTNTNRGSEENSSNLNSNSFISETQKQKSYSQWKREKSFETQNSNELNPLNMIDQAEKNAFVNQPSIFDSKIEEIDDKTYENKDDSSLSKRRKGPSLKIEIPIYDEPMPEELKIESPHRRFEEYSTQLPVDKFAHLFSNPSSIPELIKTAPVISQNFETISESFLSKSAPLESKSFNDLINYKDQNDNFENLNDTVNGSNTLDENIAMKREIFRMIMSKNLTFFLKDLDNPFNEVELRERGNTLCRIIHAEMKKLHKNKSKLFVNVIIGNIFEDTAKFGSKCFWDKDNDYQSSYVFIDDFIYCMVNTFTIS